MQNSQISTLPLFWGRGELIFQHLSLVGYDFYTVVPLRYVGSSVELTKVDLLAAYFWCDKFENDEF